ncbi:hypothetical protein SAMN04487905_109134 [Actinopolyspora xinjiangensis]|uniref:PPE family protein n=1 Tax=Actinopolyspora xinjiangensis TaxID=405564 RepID=A0A1H0VNZ9_9ACTN|nr:hypothetical protein [Actinopolyspora xinjiangensis]SDP80339.1 hypothetical protein SAMN04487905_109134 [Actinopolyspora xinjiangensis]
MNDYDVNAGDYEQAANSEEIYRQEYTRATERHSGDDLLSRLITMATGTIQATSGTDRQVRSDARRMAEQGAGLREAPAGPAVDYEGVPHERLYRMVTQGVEPGTVGELETIWLELGNGLVEFNEEIAQAIDRSDGWQGEAGDAARRFAAEVGRWAGEVGTNAQLAARNVVMQSDAAATAKNSMPEVVHFDPREAAERLNSVTDPAAYAEQAQAMRDKYAEQQEAQREAARVVRNYDEALDETAASSPRFPRPPLFGSGGGAAAETGTAGPTGGMGTEDDGDRSGGRGGGSDSDGHRRDSEEEDPRPDGSDSEDDRPRPGRRHRHDTSWPDPSWPDGEDAEDSGGKTGSPDDSTRGEDGRRTPSEHGNVPASTGSTGYGPEPSAAGGTSPGAVSAPRGGGVPGSGGGSGEFLGGVSGGTGGGRGSGGYGTGGYGRGSAGYDPGGHGRGFGGQGNPAGHGAAAAPGRGGSGGGDEDGEHERKYEAGEDPYDIFLGDMPPTAPPVIGE